MVEVEGSRSRGLTWFPVLVGALGYFVDIFDLVLFSIVRQASLTDLGVPEQALLATGVELLNWQMAGMLIGGIAWGTLGDRRGRVSVLMGSILLYSAANIVNALISSIPAYAALRFLAGVGLAGELGAAVTLVSETLPTHHRGYGTGLVAGIGLLGAVAAGIVSEYMGWRACYLLGGVLGLGLLTLRTRLFESGLFGRLTAGDRRGDLILLLGNPARLGRFLACILVGVPIWFAVGIVVTFSPELGRELGIADPVSAGKGILYCYAGIAVGDVVSGFVSQWVRSRRKVVLAGLLMEALVVLGILTSRGLTAQQFYLCCCALGFATGYWAVFVTIAAEQFGTNLRATVATSVPNFVRGSVVPMTLLFKSLAEGSSLLESAATVGILCLLCGVFGVLVLSESHGRDLDFLEYD